MLHIAAKTNKMTQKSARLSAIYTSIVLETAFISILRIKFENFLSTYYQTILNSPRPREQPLWNNGQIHSSDQSHVPDFYTLSMIKLFGNPSLHSSSTQPQSLYRACSHEIMSAMLVSQTSAMEVWLFLCKSFLA